MFEHIRAVRLLGQADRLTKRGALAEARSAAEKGLALLERAQGDSDGQLRVTRLVLLRRLLVITLAQKDPMSVQGAVRRWLDAWERAVVEDPLLLENGPLLETKQWVESVKK